MWHLSRVQPSADAIFTYGGTQTRYYLSHQSVNKHTNLKVVISDIDGTITKSDVLGHILPVIGRDWAQSGVAQLFSKIRANGYHIMYLSARYEGIWSPWLLNRTKIIPSQGDRPGQHDQRVFGVCETRRGLPSRWTSLP